MTFPSGLFVGFRPSSTSAVAGRHELADSFQIDGLRDEVERAALELGPGIGQVADRGDDDDGDLGGDHPQHGAPVHGGRHVEVEEDRVWRTGTWEVVGQPRSQRAGKSVVARVQRPGDPGTLREQWWPAYELVTVTRPAKG